MRVTRRDFLATTAAAGIALGAPVVHGAEKNKKYRTALVGSGWWGMNIFRAAIQSDEVRPVAMCDVDRNQLDPAAADVVDARNPRRVVRALEVSVLSGRPFTEQRGKDPPPYAVLQIGLTMDRQTLYCRVDRRIDQMIARGLVDEVRGLLDRGYGWTLPSMSSLGYLQFRAYFEGSVTLEETVALIKKETRRFIRHQYNWFRPADTRIHWLDAAASLCDPALELIRAFLS